MISYGRIFCNYPQIYQGCMLIWQKHLRQFSPSNEAILHIHMIHLLHEPLLRVPVLSPALAEAFSNNGYAARCCPIGSQGLNSAIRTLFSSHTALAIRSRLVVPLFNRNLLASIKPGDIVWIYTDGVLINPWHDAAFETACKRNGAQYVLHLPDAWHLANALVASGLKKRIPLVDLIATVTPSLASSMSRTFPNRSIAVAEEAIDFNLIRSLGNKPDLQQKTIVINLVPGKWDETAGLFPLLQHLSRQVRFCLRIVSGIRKPNIDLPFPWEWKPYLAEDPAASFEGAAFAIVYYPQTEYSACKGNYKVKTFMAMGLPVLTNDWGYSRQLIANGEDGFLASDDDSWKTAITTLLSMSPSQLATYGRRAREKMMARYSYDAVAKTYIAELKSHFPKEMELANRQCAPRPSG